MNKKYIKIIMLILSVFIISGCVSIRRSNIKEIVSYVVNNKNKLYNTYNNGYKYYLPRNLDISFRDDTNEILKSRYYDYYLYVDLVSYYNKTKLTYQTDDKLYYSSYIKDDEGLINISKLSDSYLIHIEYNYAKIEVKVKENDINEAISNAIIVITSIEYNDDVIRAMMTDGVLNANERDVDVFKKKDVDKSNQLDVDDSYEDEDEDNDDTDYIN